ncbi:hypothetical protein AOL_s00173g278 [Orbilia oligospora ATCC 24927]|uniref:Uncharacterized protein n=2 Tax=Orbilia oligospora TaxID=2813651 RepID=G1XPB0_ARTOA|nr:hypothetical protein AOL_s00173g278 [Orbilia oligospora ATCC 24927]EGX45177.1 hypothetical protein AOL_s00173g278 [Orbilia oligospora ATCC 24927]KAF3286895.1 hypothetical protein TWF970_008727 [Orbilia oligospora]
MKFFTVLALAVLPLAFASPIEIPEALQKRDCNYNAITACSSGCGSTATAACKSCNNNPSCFTACYNARLSQCKNCCASKCTRC